MKKRRIILILIFISLTITSLLIGVSSKITIKNLIVGDKEAWQLFVSSRIPRTLVIIFSAASLSIAGLIMQALSRNKFISPSTAGTIDAASLGVLLGYFIFTNQNIYTKFIFAFIFSLIASLVFVFLINKIKFKNIVFVPLVGLMYGGLISSLTLLIAYETNMLQVVSSLRLASYAHVGVINGSLLIVLIPPLIFAYLYANSFSIVSIGEDFSTNLGLNYKKVLVIGLIITAIIASSTFIIVGPLPFLGLIVPNLISLYYGDNLKKNLLDIGLFGASFVLLNDIFSRIVLFPYEVAVGFTMGISGAIIFIILIFKQVKGHG